MTERNDIIGRLTAPGARFETRVENVGGRPMQVFAHRQRSLVELLEASAAFGSREYLVTREGSLSFLDHYRQVSAVAEALREEHDVMPGDRVALCAANRPEWVVAFWAVVSLGAVAVGMNSMWAGPEIAHGLALTTPKVVLVDRLRRPLVERALSDVSQRVALIELAPLTADEVEIRAGDADVVTYDSVLGRHLDAELRPAAVQEDDPAVILFTGGTTGRPKGVTHSHRNMLAAVWFHLFNDQMSASLGRPWHDRRFLLATPLFHIAALHNLAVVRLAVGDTAVLHLGKFDIDRVLALVAAERVTNWGAVPTMITRLVEADLTRYDLSSLRTVSVSSAPCSAELKDRFRRALPAAAASLGTSYGLTESSTAATLATPADLLASPGTAGRPVLNMEVRVRDGDERPVAEGNEGEIQLRGPQVMLGYFDAPGDTEKAFTEDGWFRTGDLGKIDDGALSISSRRSDLILRGAENVYPAEVEHQLANHPAVTECAVSGLPDREYGQIVAAVVVMRSDSEVNEEDLRVFLSARLARYKIPTSWMLTREPLPRNATGKVMRNQVAWQ